MPQSNQQKSARAKKPKRKSYPITAQAIDLIIDSYESRSIEELRQSLADCRSSIESMRQQIKASKTPLASTEQALKHWELRAERLQSRIANKMNNSKLLDQDKLNVFTPRTSNNWTRAFVDAASDMLPPEVFGKIYQEVPSYLHEAWKKEKELKTDK